MEARKEEAEKFPDGDDKKERRRRRRRH